MEIIKELLGPDENDYGSSYRDHFLAIYETYVEMTDRISARRQTANTYYLGINTAAIGVMGYVLSNDIGREVLLFLFVLGLAGMVISFIWNLQLRSFKSLNSARFKVINNMEKLLPARPYTAEWEIIEANRGRRAYISLSSIESWVPWLFFGIHTLIVAYAVYNYF